MSVRKTIRKQTKDWIDQEQDAVDAALYDATRTFAKEVIREQKKHIRSEYKGTSKRADYVRAYVEGDTVDTDVTLHFVDRFKAANFQEDGAHLTGSPWLFVPNELGYSGRGNSRERKALQGQKQTFTVRNKRGTVVVMRRADGVSSQRLKKAKEHSAGGRMSKRAASKRRAPTAFPIGFLTHSVTIKPRLGFTRRISAMLPKLEKLLEEKLRSGASANSRRSRKLSKRNYIK